VSNPTIKSEFGTFGRSSKISLRTPGPNFAAQPGVEVIWVSGISFAIGNLLKINELLLYKYIRKITYHFYHNIPDMQNQSYRKNH